MLLVGSLDDIDPLFGICRRQGAQRVRHDHPRRQREYANAQARAIVRAWRANFLHAGMDLAQRQRQPPREFGACRIGLDARGRASKEIYAQQSFELARGSLQRGLGHVKTPGGGAKAAGLPDRDQRRDLRIPQF